MPDDTAIDGEVVALDEPGKPSFNLLQNYGSSKTSLVYYVFDVLTLAGGDVMNKPLSIRPELLAREIIPKLSDPIRESPMLDASLSDLIQGVKAQSLEGRIGCPKQRIRNFGFLANRRRSKLLPLCRELLAASPSPSSSAVKTGNTAPLVTWRCPCCGGPMVLVEKLTATQLRLPSFAGPNVVDTS